MNKTLLSLLVAGSFSCILASCGGTTLGRTCAVDADCDTGQSCFLNGFPGGFCTRGCTIEGALTECPNGTICTRTSAVNPTLFCTTLCTSDSGCRGGEYTCRAVAGSDKQACAP